MADEHIYMDKRGWLYMVKPDLSGKQFKAFYRKPDPRKPLDEGWHACRSFTWRGTAADAKVEFGRHRKKQRMEASHIGRTIE